MLFKENRCSSVDKNQTGYKPVYTSTVEFYQKGSYKGLLFISRAGVFVVGISEGGNMLQ